MRRRDALRVARSFVEEHYPDLAHRSVDIALEENGERSRSWSFMLCADEEDDDHGQDDGFTGYVHADGYVEGLY